MTCKAEFHAMSVDQIDAVKVAAQNFGFENYMISGILDKFGPEVLSLLVEAARSGFSVTWIVDTLNRFGPNVLQFFMDLWGKNVAIAAQNAPAGMAATEVHTGVILTGEVVEGMDTNMITTMLEKLLPMIVEKYGPQLIQMVMDLIMNAIKPKVGESLSAEAAFQAGLLQTLLEKLLPVMMEKYGPQLLQMLMDAIMNAVKTK